MAAPKVVGALPLPPKADPNAGCCSLDFCDVAKACRFVPPNALPVLLSESLPPKPPDGAPNKFLESPRDGTPNVFEPSFEFPPPKGLDLG